MSWKLPCWQQPEEMRSQLLLCSGAQNARHHLITPRRVIPGDDSKHHALDHPRMLSQCGLDPLRFQLPTCHVHEVGGAAQPADRSGVDFHSILGVETPIRKRRMWLGPVADAHRGTAHFEATVHAYR